MTAGSDLEKCLTYIDCHLQAPRPGTAGPAERHPPSVTISRETGAGGIAIAQHLATELERRLPGPGCGWAVFHKNLVANVLKDHHLPERLAQYMPEDRVSSIADAVEELLGLHPASWKLVHQTTETILRLVELGNVILIGRGSNVITANLDYVFHVRLVGSLDRRIARVQRDFHINREAALAFIQKEDRGRRRYLKRYFKRDVDDPLLYHLTLNTDAIGEPAAAALIAEAVLRRQS